MYIFAKKHISNCSFKMMQDFLALTLCVWPLISQNVVAFRKSKTYLMDTKVKSDHRIFQFKQLGRRSLKKSGLQRDSIEPVTSAIPVRCSTNWAMKPHIGSEVNLLSSYFPALSVKWCEYIWNNPYHRTVFWRTFDHACPILSNRYDPWMAWHDSYDPYKSWNNGLRVVQAAEQSCGTNNGDLHIISKTAIQPGQHDPYDP